MQISWVRRSTIQTHSSLCPSLTHWWFYPVNSSVPVLFFSSENDQILWALLFLYFPLITFFKTRSPIWEDEKMYCLSFTAKNGPKKKEENSDGNMYCLSLYEEEKFWKALSSEQKRKAKWPKAKQKPETFKMFTSPIYLFPWSSVVVNHIVMHRWSLRHCKPFQPNQNHR